MITFNQIQSKRPKIDETEKNKLIKEEINVGIRKKKQQKRTNIDGR